MAVAQGICKNCGSLIVYNTADEECECIFCNAIFPLAELIPMDAELKDIEFPNEKFEKNTSTTHRYGVPVLPDQVEVNVEREKRSRTLDPNVKEKVVYEVSAKDVKAPKNVIFTLIGIVAAFIIIVIAIYLPMYNSRTKLLSKMQGNMTSVVSGIVDVDTTIGEDGYSNGYSIFGNKCQEVSIVTDDDITDEQAIKIFDNYCAKREEASSIKSNSDVKITIYAQKGIYTVTDGGKVEFTEDSKPIEEKK